MNKLYEITFKRLLQILGLTPQYLFIQIIDVLKICPVYLFSAAPYKFSFVWHKNVLLLCQGQGQGRGQGQIQGQGQSQGQDQGQGQGQCILKAGFIKKILCRPVDSQTSSGGSQVVRALD